MAEPIVPKFPPKESDKNKLKPDSNIDPSKIRHRSTVITGSINVLAKPSMVKTEGVCYHPRPADYSVGILEETVLNLTRLHEDLCKV